MLRFSCMHVVFIERVNMDLAFCEHCHALDASVLFTHCLSILFIGHEEAGANRTLCRSPIARQTNYSHSH